MKLFGGSNRGRSNAGSRAKPVRAGGASSGVPTQRDKPSGKNAAGKNQTLPSWLRRTIIAISVIALMLVGGVVAFEIWIAPPAIDMNSFLANHGGDGPGEETPGGNAEDNTDETPDSAETGRKKYCYTFLVVGRDQVSGSTDTVLMGMLDTKNGKLNIISIPRDTLINSSYNVKKINYVYPASVNNGGDGITDLKAAIKNMIGYEVDSYAVINLMALQKLIDAIGGVYYDVPRNMYYDAPDQDLYINIQAGYQKLSGEDAVKVFRFREGNNGSGYPDGDIGRINTQHDFLMSIAKQMLTLGNIPNLTKAIDIFEEYVDTNLSANNLAFFAQEFLKLDSEDITFATLPGDYNGSILGLSYVYTDIDAWVAMLNEYMDPFYDEITEDNLDMLTRINGTFYATQGYIAGGEYSFHDYRTAAAMD